MKAYVLALIAALGADCSSAPPNKQLQPLETAVARARNDLNCPSASGVILNQNVIKPMISGPQAPQISRIDYTVGVTGCGQRETYSVFCQLKSGSCVAGTAGERR